MLFYNYIIYPIETFYKILYLLLADWLCNYGLAVVALSLLNFLILYPFAKKAQEVQQEEAHLQGILQEQIRGIKQEYSGAEQFEKIQRLYDRYGYHPVMAIRSILGLLIQLPFLLAAFYMLSNCSEIQGVSWGTIPSLGKPDGLLNGLNILPFLMTFVSVLYAFLMPDFDRKQKLQTVIVSVLFLFLLYSAPSALLIFWTCNIFWSLLNSVFSKKLQWISCFINENEPTFSIILALTLTAGIFVPLEAYIKNAGQLWFGVKDIVKFFFLKTLQCSGILLLAYIICWRKKVRYLYLSILLGVLFGVFLQSYIIGLDYGLFDGHEIQWEEYTLQGIANTFIWLVCLGGAFVFFHHLQFDKERIVKIVKPIIFGIVSIQCVVLSLTLIKKPLPVNAFQKRESINVLTTKDMFNISSKKNIIVFLLDAFDAKIFEEIIAKEPDIIKELDGFTFYPDTTSVYGYTNYSVPQILTGKIYYDDRPYAEYFERAWANNYYYEELKKKNFDIGMFTEGSHVSKKAPVINLITEKIVVSDDSMRTFNQLVLFRMAPHYIKKAFYDYNPNAWVNLLANRSTQAYIIDDRAFYNSLKNGLIYHNDKNSFRFYHLEGAHVPFNLDRNLELVKENGKSSQYEQSVGTMKIVLEYIRQMKRKGVFENSTFVIMADHGDPNTIGSRPLLCAKFPNSNYDTMIISNKSVSFTQFLPFLFQQNGTENDSISSLNTRVFYYMDEEKGFVEYQIRGNSKEKSSWHRIRNIRDNNNQDKSYLLGENVDFTIHGNSKRFKGAGWSKREENFGTWTLGTDAELSFRIKDYHNHNLKLAFVAFSYLADLPYRTVKVYINKEYVTDLVFNNKNSNHSLIIPSSMVTDGNLLNVQFNIDHPGTSVKYEEGRDLGIFMQSLKIEADETR